MRKFYRIPMVVGILLLALNSFSQNGKAIADLVKKDAKKLHLSSADAETFQISNFHTEEHTGITYVYLQQRHKDVKVYNSLISATYKDNKLVYSSGRFVDSLSFKALKSEPSLPASGAVTRTLQELKLPVNDVRMVEDRFASEKKILFSPEGVAKRNIEAELLWLPADTGKTVKLVWNINIDVLNSADWWNVFIDAHSGQYISKQNMTVYEDFNHRSNQSTQNSGHSTPRFVPGTASSTFHDHSTEKQQAPPNVSAATYNVVPFPNENLFGISPAQVTSPWQLAGAGNNATTNGWHFDGTNNYSTTRGNNVFAYLDVTNTNTSNSINNWPDTSTTSAPSLTFVNTPSFSNPAKELVNRKFALNNLFYWNNLMHDVFYQYGFTESAGNFQRDNLGRGGAGNDWVNAEAQDGGGFNNANFAITADGVSPRMQMFLWQSDTLVYITSPASIAKGYMSLESATTLSTTNKLRTVGPVTGQLVYYNDAAGTTHEACGPGASPANSITGKIALIDRGTCNFTEKILNAQNAGAIGVIVVNNVPGVPGIMGAAAPDNTIVIPAVMISQSDGAAIAAQLGSGVTVTLTDGLRDGSLDNGIVCHEYGHGISSRLTGGASNPGCLSNAEQGGEGWSDYFALMMTTDWSKAATTDGTKPRAVGAYAAGGGIRNYPYSTNLSVSPLTYGNMGVAPIGTGVHNIGEIWCAALWDMTWNIIQQQNAITPNLYDANGSGGNAIALNLVMTGLKLQPCTPGFLDARDAILAADSILYNNAHKCAIWDAFARRGMGLSAAQGSAGSATDQVPAFDKPSGLSLLKNDAITVHSGGTFSISTSAKCDCQPLTGYVVRDTIPAGFTVVNSTPSGTLNGNVYTFAASNFAAQETKSFSLTLQVTMPGCAIDSVINDNREETTIGNLTSTATGAGGGWNTSTVKSYSGTSSWKATEPATISTSSLTSSVLAATGGQGLSVLSFWHHYNTEKSYDGGVVEYSTNGGTTWTDASSLFLKNGYNASMDASTVLAGRKAFTGTNVNFGQSMLNLSSFGTTPVTVRFRMTSDDGTAGEGWFIDNIVRANGCGALLKSGVYNSLGTLVDTVVTPVFVKNTPATITITSQPSNVTICEGQNVNINIGASSATALSYKWQLSTNGGTSFTDITGQTTSTLSLTSVTTGMTGYQYRCVITDATSSINSNTVTLTVNPQAAITGQPADKTVCVNTPASFTTTATGVTGYQWEVSTDGGASFATVSGATSSTLGFTAALAQNNYKYRCLLTSSCGNLTSSVVTLTVLNAGITGQPASLTKCAGDNAVFSVTTAGTVTNYQWEISTNGGASFSAIAGETTANLTLSAVTTGMNNNQYRCVVTSACGPITSSVATLAVNGQPAVSTQPVDRTVCVNTNASFAITATGVTGYQWQVSIDGGASFAAISGATISTLSFTAALAQNNYKYRVVLTNGCGSVTSSVVTLNVGDAAIATQPVNTTKCAGENATFSVAGSGTISGYQWQVSTNGGTSFNNIAGATTASLSLPSVTAAMNNNQYQVVLTAPCGTITSSAATLTVTSTNISITALPARICLTDSPVSLNATPAGGVWSGTAVSGNSFTPATAGIGTYTLTYTYTAAGNCVSTATSTANVEDCINRNLTVNNGGIILYPVPNNGQFFLQVKSLLFNSFGVKVYNGVGQLVAQQEFKNVQYDQKLKMNLNGANAGVYMVKVYTNVAGKAEEKTFSMLIAH